MVLHGPRCSRCPRISCLARRCPQTGLRGLSPAALLSPEVQRDPPAHAPVPVPGPPCPGCPLTLPAEGAGGPRGWRTTRSGPVKVCGS